MRVYASEKFTALNRPFTAPKLGDAGYDLYATESTVILPHQRTAVGTGLHFEIPDGFVGFVSDRSSVALKQGIATIGGVIDSSYRGEVHVILLNTTDNTLTVDAGAKIAQMVVLRHYAQDVIIVGSLDELSETLRGDAGFGSTGA
jgi:dUTP pyrophosphatase